MKPDCYSNLFLKKAGSRAGDGCKGGQILYNCFFIELNEQLEYLFYLCENSKGMQAATEIKRIKEGKARVQKEVSDYLDAEILNYGSVLPEVLKKDGLTNFKKLHPISQLLEEDDENKSDELIRCS